MARRPSTSGPRHPVSARAYPFPEPGRFQGKGATFYHPAWELVVGLNLPYLGGDMNYPELGVEPFHHVPVLLVYPEPGTMTGGESQYGVFTAARLISLLEAIGEELRSTSGPLDPTKLLGFLALELLARHDVPIHRVHTVAQLLEVTSAAPRGMPVSGRERARLAATRGAAKGWVRDLAAGTPLTSLLRPTGGHVQSLLRALRGDDAP